MTNWNQILSDLKQSGQVFTIYLRYMQKDTLAKIRDVRVSEVFQDHVKLENESGFGILSFDDILYLSIPKR